MAASRLLRVAGLASYRFDHWRGDAGARSLRAVTMVTNANYKPALEVLKKVVDSQAFLSRDVDEKGAYIDGIRKLGGKAAIAFLQQQASRSTLVFNRKAMAEIRDAALKALDAIKLAGK